MLPRAATGRRVGMDAGALVEMLRRMLRIRLFDEAALALQQQGLLPGPMHASTGQEAAVTGACMALRDGDWMTGSHRSHGHPIAKGAALGPLMAELLGRRDGVCAGKGGSMHLADFSVGSLGESAIVGAGIPIATGAGLAARIRHGDGVCLCFFGDGASNQGAFHEALNMAAIWSLPVVYLCENNLYAATTPMRDSTAVSDVADRASAYAMPGVVVDGQDAIAVHEAVCRAVERARAGRGPSLVEAKTYRYREHADGEPIPDFYRSRDEIEAWRARDPIALHRARLAERGVLDREAAERLERAVRVEIDAAVAFAKASAPPPVEAALTDVYAVGPAASRAAEPPPGQREISYLQAIFEAEREEMLRDSDVFLIGEDVALLEATGVFEGVPRDRIWSAPISENGFVGMAVGAALCGLRPIVDLTIASLVYVAMDAIVNQAAKARYLYGNQAGVPLVIRAGLWHGHAYAAQHSDRPYPMFMNVPGLRIVVPATAYDVKGLLKAAVRCPDPVLVFEDKALWFEAGPVPADDYEIPLGRAAVRRAGSDATLVAIGSSLREALAAAEALAGEGLSVEVIDPRSLAPLDDATLLASVRKTGRLAIADPAHRTAGAAAEIAALVAERAFGQLRAPIARVATPDVPIPFSPALERSLYPRADAIAEAVRALCA
jgi:TPP-dependent pyruvate/acetoin dehydrogenase alpha subunit/pyruvate/2-oxoglutarate/acetoin dehydrogenase E1 component